MAYHQQYSTLHFWESIHEALSCCESCSTVVSLPAPTCAPQKKRANALHVEERAIHEDGSYGLLSLPPFKGPLGVNPKQLR